MPIAPVDVGFRGEADTGQRFRYRDFKNTRPQEPRENGRQIRPAWGARRCIISCKCELAYSSLATSPSKVQGGLWCQEADMAQDSLTFRFAVVLALAVIILVVMTLAAPPCPANDDTATPIVSSNPIYRAQYLNLY